jgi:DNA polymerase I
MVAYVLDESLRHERTIRVWRDEFPPAPPFDIGPDTLFVAYSAWAELTCFLQLGWPFPKHVFDLHTCYLAASNILLPHDYDEVRKKPSKGLSAACCAYGIEGWERIDKKDIAKAIGEGTWRGRYSPQEIFDCCEEDVGATAPYVPPGLARSRRTVPATNKRPHSGAAARSRWRRRDCGGAAVAEPYRPPTCPRPS